MIFGDGQNLNRAQTVVLNNLAQILSKKYAAQVGNDLDLGDIDEDDEAVEVEGKIANYILAELANPSSGVWTAYAELSSIQPRIAAQTNVNGFFDTVKGWFGFSSANKTAAQVNFINSHINAEIANALLAD